MFTIMEAKMASIRITGGVRGQEKMGAKLPAFSPPPAMLSWVACRLPAKMINSEYRV
ncbi:hypothetical protein [Kamptonema formosum]|uniref:hypothetical protein n=1 Tax=Kamptonema formosum TaxID=331992 RepID=UPI00034B5FAD|nr:hypothetical protein [Oscillatoria sp. PCC 10802]